MLTTLDWSIVAIYFAVVFAVAYLVTRREGTRASAAGYFLGGRNTGWFVIGASLFASNIGSEHLIGLAVTMTRGCQVCTRNRVEKARNIGLTDDEINALIAVTSAVNSGVTAATARVAFGMLEEEQSGDCGDACSPNPQ